MSARFQIHDTPLDGLKLLERRAIGDQRGFLQRLFCASELAPVLGDRAIAQVNYTLTAKRGTVRGLHFQRPPSAETKFVTCLRGEVFDVAVDVRHGSPTFLRWHAVRLRAAEALTYLLPEGFAHGFQTLTDDCELLYFHTAPYDPASEQGLNPSDPSVGISGPEAITEISARDASAAMIDGRFAGVAL